ncbi:S1 family peptidase [Amycolatopsis regifaucium]|uniref:Trypsin n=1 Tax=Amycolatopsis regifaucium TaxID=546365 RepID=A0A154M3G0_9PSEU|nr:trypsin-like serine protease [Amycolatopsis regifaucium]KZB79151.1 trypsin [Amycolatopsis regifaucium]OKA07335.1 trypsin [Amycolatopsis regifaucium]SFH14067.1 Trypsin [Amycolatopsis regifaucium]
MRIRGLITALLCAAGLTAAVPAAGAVPIIDGEYAQSGSWAAMIEQNGEQWCSGSIIGARWVLTAEHCVDEPGAGYSVRVGDVDNQAGTYAAVTDVYTPSGGADIALLRLDRSVSTTYASLGTSVSAGDTEYVYGWGYNEDGVLQRYLKVARMTVTSVGSGLIKARRGDGLTNGGDSGGPVFVDGKQVGVHIAGNKVDSSTHTGIAANRTWIRDTSGV